MKKTKVKPIEVSAGTVRFNGKCQKCGKKGTVYKRPDSYVFCREHFQEFYRDFPEFQIPEGK